MSHPTRWRTSSFSDGAQNCVELAPQPGGVSMRDSKHPGGGELHFSRAELAAFVSACKAGHYDDLTHRNR